MGSPPPFSAYFKHALQKFDTLSDFHHLEQHSVLVLLVWAVTSTFWQL